MEPDGPGIRQTGQFGRKNMLPAVLLHVVETAGPVDATLNDLPYRQD
jgi:hypothetical protein